jgi:isocitrate dehydrogenase (NAD+)
MYTITLIPGDGIGPEVVSAAQMVIEATGIKIKWDIQNAGEAQIKMHGTPLPEETIHSIKRTGIALKGPVNTPKGIGFRSANVALRKKFDLYANLRPALSYPNVPSRYDNVDIVVVRENTEDLYAGIERMVNPDTAESIKIFTRKGCERIVRFAFDYAQKHNRKKVTSVHKANIMKCTDGMFLEVSNYIAKEYPSVEYEDIIVDALCMKLVLNPEDYDVLVLPNLYGDIVSDLCAGLVGGPGLAPGANIGVNCAIFEAIHGSAPDIAGKGIANPTALILSGVMMLRHLGELEAANRIEKAIISLISKGEEVTCDLGGSLSTQAFADAVCSSLAK